MHYPYILAFLYHSAISTLLTLIIINENVAEIYKNSNRQRPREANRNKRDDGLGIIIFNDNHHLTHPKPYKTPQPLKQLTSKDIVAPTNKFRTKHQLLGSLERGIEPNYNNALGGTKNGRVVAAGHEERVKNGHNLEGAFRYTVPNGIIRRDTYKTDALRHEFDFGYGSGSYGSVNTGILDIPDITSVTPPLQESHKDQFLTLLQYILRASTHTNPYKDYCKNKPINRYGLYSSHCQSFYYCNGLRLEYFALCPLTTLFDEISQTCNYEHLVDKRTCRRI